MKYGVNNSGGRLGDYCCNCKRDCKKGAGYIIRIEKRRQRDLVVERGGPRMCGKLKKLECIKFSKQSISD